MKIIPQLFFYVKNISHLCSAINHKRITKVQTNILNKNNMAVIPILRERRSVFLTKDEMKLLKAKRKQFHTGTEFSQHMNIVLPTLNRIMELGRGSETNIGIIQSLIS